MERNDTEQISMAPAQGTTPASLFRIDIVLWSLPVSMPESVFVLCLPVCLRLPVPMCVPVPVCAYVAVPMCVCNCACVCVYLCLCLHVLAVPVCACGCACDCVPVPAPVEFQLWSFAPLNKRSRQS